MHSNKKKEKPTHKVRYICLDSDGGYGLPIVEGCGRIWVAYQSTKEDTFQLCEECFNKCTRISDDYENQPDNK